MTLGAPAANFDRLARVYAAIERLSFGHALERRRACFLEEAERAEPRRALILGDGDGRFTAALLQRRPTLEVTALDASAAMLGALDRRVRRQTPNANVELRCTDVRSWRPEHAQFDLVATHFFFDCFTTAEVAAIVRRIAPAVDEGGYWLFSDFAIPTRPFWAVLARCLVSTLYFAQRLFTGSRIKQLPEHASALRAAGFQLTESRTSWGGMLRSELWRSGSR
ncbi:MAG: class I SAM-dependent methyltransferase [Polyangiaceae bacterium]